MSIKFNSVAALIAQMNSTQSQRASRTSFDSGLQLAPVWNMVSSFDIDSLETDYYRIQPREEEIITAVPEIASCGQDIPVVGGTYDDREIPFTPTKRRLAIQLCKDKCGPQNFRDKFLKAEKEAGAGFGKLLEQMFWAGDGVHGAGITRVLGTEFRNVSGTPYANLHQKNAVEVANFFSMISWGMTDPVFYIGSITGELLGWREQSAEKCSEVWECIIATLSRRLGETVATTQARFKYVPSFDNVTGIDSNAPTDANSMFMVLDRDFVKMGVSNNEELGVAIGNGHDLGEVTRAMYLSAPQVHKYGSAQFAFGFVPHADVLAREGGRYGDRGIPSLTVPTPIV